MSLGWAITMCAGPPDTLDCKKRSKKETGGVLLASGWFPRHGFRELGKLLFNGAFVYA